MNWLKSIRDREEKRTPLELLEVARLGGEASTVKKVMDGVLKQELQSIISQFAGTKPDLGQYAFFAGQVSIINKILRSLDLQANEGKEAAAQIKGGH